jgi:hypothetical protein
LICEAPESLHGVLRGFVMPHLALEARQRVEELGVGGVQADRGLQSGQRFGKAMESVECEAEFVPGMGVAGIESGGPVQRFEGFRQAAGLPEQAAEMETGPRSCSAFA